MKTVLVIGAGWAGLTAAIRLTQAGQAVTLLDSAPHAGGRARTQTLTLAGQTLALDNGQHLLLGAYERTLQLLTELGVAPESVLKRRRLHLRATDGLNLRAVSAPAPLNLLGGLLMARGLTLGERLALARALAPLRLHGLTRLSPGMTVQAWLAQRRQPAALIERVWQPLCLGALNTRVDQACARTFARVLTDGLLQHARAADFLIPHSTLGAVLPEPALAWLQRHHASVMLRTPCRSLQRLADGPWQAHTDRGIVAAQQVVLAIPPHHLTRMLAPSHLAAPIQAELARFEYESIATVWLGWQETIALPSTLMLSESPDQDAPGQWLFRRDRPDQGPLRTVAAVVISGCQRYPHSPTDLAQATARQLVAQAGLPPPTAARAIIERHATIRCTPDRPRLATDALVAQAPGLYLAGDWVWHDYPATLESAVRSGEAAAARLLGTHDAAGPGA